MSYSTSLLSVLRVSVVLYYVYVDHCITVGLEEAHSVLGEDPDDPGVQHRKNSFYCSLVFWNMFLHKLYFNCCLIEILFGIPLLNGCIPLRRVSRNIRRVLLSSLLFPTTLLVFINYWTSAVYDPTSVFLQNLPKGPSWIHHACYTLILPIDVFETYLRASEEDIWGMGSFQPHFFLQGCSLIFALSLGMATAVSGIGPYPILNQLSKKKNPYGLLYHQHYGHNGPHLSSQIVHSNEEQNNTLRSSGVFLWKNIF